MILASYADLKIIKTRSVVQIVVEIPLERGKEVTDLLGLPQPGAEVPVVVARMDPAMLRKRQEEQAADRAAADRSRRPLSQVAAVLCNVVAFRRFLEEEHGARSVGSDEAADWLRTHCGVTSRRELDTNDIAAAKFKRLRDEYDLWMRCAA